MWPAVELQRNLKQRHLDSSARHTDTGLASSNSTTSSTLCYDGYLRVLALAVVPASPSHRIPWYHLLLVVVTIMIYARGLEIHVFEAHTLSI